MRIPSAIYFMLLFVGCTCFADHTRVCAQSSADFREIRKVTEPGPASIRAFDISPDGKLLAVLSQSEATHDSWLRILIEDVGTGKALTDLKLDTTTRPDPRSLPPWYLPHVEFSADQRFLAVQDWERIRIVSLSTFQVVRTFTSTSAELTVPFSILGASKKDLFLISYGTNLPSNWGNKGFNDLVNPHVHNELVDVSTGQRESNWESKDIPQSLSADGKLAAVSDWDGNTPVVEIEIINVQTGKKLNTLRSGYRFKKPWAPGPAGRVIAKFLTDDEILLSPDEHIDRSGHKSGEAIKILRVSDGQLVREIRPEDFGPMGEIATSAGRNCFVALNWYISPGIAKRDLAPTSLPELLVFPDPADARSYKISQLSLDAPITGEFLRGFGPRISNDASVVAVAQSGGVVVLRRN